MNALPRPIQEAIEALSNLPGIGQRSAERLVLNILNNKSDIDQKIASSIGGLKKNIQRCSRCHHYCEDDLCPICQNEGRDQSTLCVLDSPLDLIALERCHEYKGYYHVLHGVLSPLNKVKPEDLTMNQLFDRIKKSPEIQEVIIATPSNTEGDATALYIRQELKPIYTGKITQLSRGIPTGGDLDYLDIGTLGRALMDRREY